MSEIAISARNLGKTFRINAERRGYRTLRDAITRMFHVSVSRRPKDNQTFWALKDVSFDIRQGDVVGIIGRNGAGKSTLLKILSKITETTEGYAEVRGRVGSLLEVGTGFHPELTGRENVFLNGAILGMRKTEIQSKFDEIVSFAEVEQFLDTPVKHYSTGMYLRLAFAVAAHLEPEILVVDEVLAVGDLQFQEKCLGKMGHVARAGRTVLFVSHNMSAIEALCNRALVLNNGKLSFDGDLHGGIKHYVGQQTQQDELLSMRRDRTGSGKLRFHSITVASPSSSPTTQEPGYGLPLKIVLELSAESDPPKGSIDVAVIVRNQLGQNVTSWATFLTGNSLKLEPQVRNWRLSCEVPGLQLIPDRYRLDLWCGQGPELIDAIKDVALLDVGAGLLREVKDARKPIARKHGSVLLPHHWRFDSL